MNIKEFKKELRKNSKSSGGRFRKADFHIHMPGSSDYEYIGQDAMAKMADAINIRSYAFAVVLEHQKFPDKAKIDQLQQLCPNTAIIPGAEVNIFVDALEKKVHKDHFFHCIVAVDPQQAITDYNYLIADAKKKLTYKGSGDYPSGFTSSI